MVASASRKSVTWLRKASTFDLPVKGTPTISRTRNRAGLASLLDQRLQSCLIKHGCTISKGRRITRSHRQVDSVLAKIQRPLSSALSFGKVRLCEGFRMPALCRGMPSGRDGAGVRKPPRKETASRKGAYPPHALWGFESRQRLLGGGRNDHQRRFRRIERSDGVFFAGHGMILFSAAVLGRVGRRIFGRAGAARSNDQRQKRAELRRRG